MPPARSLAEQLADLDDPAPKGAVIPAYVSHRANGLDFDPEDLDHAGQGSDEDTGAAADSNAGREHYQSVGYVFVGFVFLSFLLIFGRKAKLRKPEPINLGKQYAGSRVSRDALEVESDESDNEPFQSHSSDGNTSEGDAEDVDMVEQKSPKLQHTPEEGDTKRDVDGPAVGNTKKVGKHGLDMHKNEAVSRNGLPGLHDEVQDTDQMQSPHVLSKRRRKSVEESDEENEDEAVLDKLGEADVERALGHQISGQRSGHRPTLREQSDEDEGDDSVEGSVSVDSESEGDDEEDEEGESPAVKRGHGGDHDGRHGDGKGVGEREELRRLLSSDQKTIAAEISKAAKGDAEKGRAVKRQRATFDALLNTRIKVQKGFSAADQLPFTEHDPDNGDASAIKSAESAALTLWSTLENLRLAMADAQSGDESKKRKRSPVSPATSTSSLWKRMADLEADSVAHRRAVLDKWSLKVRGSSATVPNARGKLLGSATGGQQNISAILDAQIASEVGERNTKRARRETSGQDNAEPVYDDAVFYQSLLRDLVEQRISSESITNSLDSLHIQLSSRPSIHPVTGMRNDKVKKDVDTRASKGRKIRYHVHEKLQNFMAPEDRGTWTDRAREEFFASLLGKTASGLLGEDHDDASAESEEDVEEGGLRLFRG